MAGGFNPPPHPITGSVALLLRYMLQLPNNARSGYAVPTRPPMKCYCGHEWVSGSIMGTPGTEGPKRVTFEYQCVASFGSRILLAWEWGLINSSLR